LQSFARHTAKRFALCCCCCCWLLAGDYQLSTAPLSLPGGLARAWFPLTNPRAAPRSELAEFMEDRRSRRESIERRRDENRE
jgi:hypothetical protein